MKYIICTNEGFIGRTEQKQYFMSQDVRYAHEFDSVEAAFLALDVAVEQWGSGFNSVVIASLQSPETLHPEY